MRQLPVVHESDSEIEPTAESNINVPPDIIGVRDIIDFDKVARLTFIVDILLLATYVGFMSMAVIVDWSVVSASLSVSSLLSGAAVGLCRLWSWS